MTRALDLLRVALGAILVVTGLQYFLPGLLPFLPAAQWEDAMAIRLLTEFDKSGLLAVAKFIHIAAGLLLIGNRAVPFALAALLPVNLCGTFIAVLIERDPLLAVLALGLLALNGVLMLAYLPAYNRVLAGGQLADGEGPEDGRNFTSLYVDLRRHAPADAYLGGALTLLAAAAFYWFVVPGFNSATGLAVIAIPAVLLAVGWVRALGRKSR